MTGRGRRRLAVVLVLVAVLLPGTTYSG